METRRRISIMKKHYKNDCSYCHEYPDECADCCSEVKAAINLKTYRNKKRDVNKNQNIIYNN